MANVVMSEVDYNKLLTDARGTVTEFGARNKGALVHVGKRALMTVGAVGLGWWLLNHESVNKIDVFRDHWWLKPLLTLAVGWWLWRKGNPWAMTVLALGAALFVKAYLDHEEAEKAKKAQAQKTPASGPYFDEAGAVAGYGYPGAYGAPAYGTSAYGAPAGRWIRTAQGTDMWLPEGQRHDLADDLAGRIYERAA
jgi:hypothetical protein